MPKKIIFIILCSFFLLNIHAQDTSFKKNVSLVATNKKEIKKYKTGASVFIKYKDAGVVKKIKSRFLGEQKGLAVFGKNFTADIKYLISTDSIIKTRNIIVKNKIAFLLGSALFTGAVGYFLDNTANGMAFAVMIPVLLGGLGVFYGVSFTALIEKIYECNKKNGWQFSLAEIESKKQ